MSTDLPDYCPGCEPNRENAVVSWCFTHIPRTHGSADTEATPLVGVDHINGNQEVGGESNRAWCDFFHGQHRHKYV